MTEEKLKVVKSAMNEVSKMYGQESIMLLGDNMTMDVEKFSSGSLSLDYALGGGIPKGRIIEIYGPESSGKTTIALHMIAEVQKDGGAAAFIDAEHALDPEYAKNIGVKTDEVAICQPDCGEQALGIAEKLVNSGAFDLIVIDSVAALVPKAELEGEMGAANIGLQARLMSQALRKLTGPANKNKCTIVFINQLRDKVGVMYGCLHADTIIPLADGRSFPIRKIVDEKIQGEVWAYDEKEEKFVKKPIIDWHYNGEVVENRDYIHIETGAFDSDNGTSGITVTPDHKVMTKDGWKSAKDLTVNDYLLSKYKSIINGTLEDFLYGTFVGDSTISIRDKNTAAIKLQDNNNKEYAEWKVNKLSPFFEFRSRLSNQYVRHESNFSTELAIVKNIIGDRNPLVFLKYHFSPLGLALWYMDDGNFDSNDYHCRASISIKRIAKDKALMASITEAFANIGLIGTFDKYGSLSFDKENTLKLFDMIAEYIPDCMQYKLDDSHKGLYKDFALSSEETLREGYVPIKSIRIASDKQMKQRGKYDLTIKDCHNYIAGGMHNGVLVHNSPETTAGGRALKFYASVRLDVRKTETLKTGQEAVANHVKVRVVKNKIAPPLKVAEFDIAFGEGIVKKTEIAELAKDMGIVVRSGPMYAYKDIKVKGMDAFKSLLDNDPELMEEIVSAIKAELYSTEKTVLPYEEPVESTESDEEDDE